MPKAMATGLFQGVMIAATPRAGIVRCRQTHVSVRPGRPHGGLRHECSSLLDEPLQGRVRQVFLSQQPSVRPDPGPPHPVGCYPSSRPCRTGQGVRRQSPPRPRNGCRRYDVTRTGDRHFKEHLSVHRRSMDIDAGCMTVQSCENRGSGFT